MARKVFAVILSVFLLVAVHTPCTAVDIPEDNLSVVEARLTEGLQNYALYIDLRDLGIQVDMYADEFSPKFQKLLDIANRLVKEHGSFRLGELSVPYCSVLFEMQPSAGNDNPYGVDKNDCTGASIFYYTDYCEIDKAPDATLYEDIKKTVSENYERAIAAVPTDLSDAEKALLLYDYVIAASNYPNSIGTDEFGRDYYENKHYSEIAFFYEGLSVCLGNANAYAALLTGVGIDAITVTSADMNHEWVMLKLDGTWYHADSTWDDNRYEGGFTQEWDVNDDPWDLGAATHDYFLKSDEEFLDLFHYGWELSKDYTGSAMEKAPKADKSGAWADAFFSGNTVGSNLTQFSYIDGAWYFLDRLNCKIVVYEDGVYTYPDWGENIKYVQGDGQRLFLCESNAIYMLNPENGEKKTIAAATAYGSNAIFTEMRLANGYLEAVAVSPGSKEGEYHSHTLKKALSEVETFPPTEPDPTEPTPTEPATTGALGGESASPVAEPAFFLGLLLGIGIGVALPCSILIWKKRRR